MDLSLLYIMCLLINMIVFNFLDKPPVLHVSYKPQKISPKSQGTVRMLLHDKIRDAYIHPQFVTDVIKPLQVERLFDQEVKFSYYTSNISVKRST